LRRGTLGVPGSFCPAPTSFMARATPAFVKLNEVQSPLHLQ
jgi:hypothetical protein